MSETIKSKVIQIIADQAILEVSDISMDQSLEDLGIDSLGLVEWIFAIEEAFDIQVPFNANDPKASEFDISSVASIVAAVQKLVADQTQMKRVVITGAGTINALGARRSRDARGDARGALRHRPAGYPRCRPSVGSDRRAGARL